MKRIFLSLPLLALVAAFLVGCQKEKTPWIPPSKEEEEKEEETVQPGEYLLPLIETTDLHGYLVSQSNGTVHYRMAYIADKVNDIRGRGRDCDKSRLLLLDGGDIYQGASISNLLDGKPVYVAMHRMGYDAVAVGNHEFDWDFETLVDPDATMLDYEWKGQEYDNAVPVLCANLYRDGERVSATGDYVILEKKAMDSEGNSIPVRVGVIGFAINYASSIMTSKFTGKGYSIREDFSIANGIAAELETTGQCDATILLIHGAADAAAGKLGADSPIDLVLGGHSHQTMTGTAGSVAYLQGGRYGEHFASASLKFSTENGAVSFAGVVNAKIVPVDSNRDRHTTAGQNADDLEEDILAVSDDALEATAEQTGEVIGYITVSADTYTIAGSAGRSCTMANWMCDIIRRIGDAEVAFVNGGGVRTVFPLEGQSRRDITVANVYEMFPFNNTTYVYEITYQDLMKLLEYSLTDGGVSLFTGMVGVNCYFKGYAVTMLSRENGDVIYQNGTWVDDWGSRKLRLAVSEYLATNQRVDNYTKLKNPLLDWNGTSRLLSNDLVDNENAVRVLREEGIASGGPLFIDTTTHFFYVQ